MVCFIHRPEYYKMYKDTHGNDLRGVAEIIIAKHRNGAVGDVRLRFRGEFARFANIEDEGQVPFPGEEGEIIQSRMNERIPSMSGDDQFDSITSDMAPF
jgi:replicative DNA helicase